MLASPPTVAPSWPEVIDLALDLLVLGGVIEDDSTFAAACRKADAAARSRPASKRLDRLRRLMEPGVSLDQAYREINYPRRSTTRSRSPSAPAVVLRSTSPRPEPRLARCDKRAIADIDRWLSQNGIAQ
jgi:hypothetical protein